MMHIKTAKLLHDFKALFVYFSLPLAAISMPWVHAWSKMAAYAVTGVVIIREIFFILSPTVPVNVSKDS